MQFNQPNGRFPKNIAAPTGQNQDHRSFFIEFGESYFPRAVLRPKQKVGGHFTGLGSVPHPTAHQVIRHLMGNDRLARIFVPLKGGLRLTGRLRLLLSDSPAIGDDDNGKDQRQVMYPPFHYWPNGYGTNRTHDSDAGCTSFSKKVIFDNRNVSFIDLLDMNPTRIRRLITAAFACLFNLATVATVKAEQFALVIGNSNYDSGGVFYDHPTASADADLVSTALSQAGFTVTTVKNVSKTEMEKSVRTLATTIEEGDTVFFYFSGRGLQAGGRHHLIGAMREKKNTDLLDDISLTAEDIVKIFDTAGASLTAAILDCERLKPNSHDFRSGDGKAGIDVDELLFNGSVVMLHATSPGEALEMPEGSDWTNSALAQSLAKRIPEKSELDRFLKSIMMDIFQVTNRKQRAWYNKAGIAETLFESSR